MTIYQLKGQFQDILRPLVHKLHARQITPNQVTIYTCLASVWVGMMLLLLPSSRAMLLFIPFFMFIRMALNAIDGMLAKEFNQQSNLGAVLNEITDVVSDMALYLPFAAHPEVNGVAVVAVVMLAILSEMAGLIPVLIGVKRRFDGPMGKSDRAFVFGLVALLLAFFGKSILITFIVNGIFIITLLLLIGTVVNRLYLALVESSR